MKSGKDLAADALLVVGLIMIVLGLLAIVGIAWTILLIGLISVVVSVLMQKGDLFDGNQG
jgi:hypothetical protein